MLSIMKMKKYKITESLENIPRILDDFPNQGLKLDTEICMHCKSVNLLKSGKKTYLIRYAEGKISFPSSKNLPLIVKSEEDMAYRKQAGKLNLHELVVKAIHELSEEDAVKNGGSSKAELIAELEKEHGQIPPNRLVSIYTGIKYIEAYQEKENEKI